MRVREADDFHFATWAWYLFIGVISHYKVASTVHCRCIKNIKQHVRSQIIRVFRYHIPEALAQRTNASICKDRIMADKVGEQVVQIPERVVYRGGSHQD